jgi:hypothetical protein
MNRVYTFYRTLGRAVSPLQDIYIHRTLQHRETWIYEYVHVSTVIPTQHLNVLVIKNQALDNIDIMDTGWPIFVELRMSLFILDGLTS